MKKVIGYFSGALMSLFFTSAVYAQTTPSMQQDQTAPKMLNDPAMSQRLQTDLTGRQSTIGDNLISWWDSGYGYNGTYTIDDVDYMTNYDKKGNYVGSYKKGNWTKVPPTFRTNFDQSQYKGQNVTGYWESSDPSKKGYYLELDNGKGRLSKVWVDDKNKYSTSPPMIDDTKPKD